jgi:hypothetical protein
VAAAAVESLDPAGDSRKLSPPEDALRLGFELVAEIERCTPRWPCDGDCALLEVLLGPVEAGPDGAMFRSDRELPDLDPSLSG